jgi:hypothetical protein
VQLKLHLFDLLSYFKYFLLCYARNTGKACLIRAITASDLDLTGSIPLIQDIPIELMTVHLVSNDIIGLDQEVTQPTTFHSSSIESCSAAVATAAQIPIPILGSFTTTSRQGTSCVADGSPLHSQKHKRKLCYDVLAVDTTIDGYGEVNDLILDRDDGTRDDSIVREPAAPAKETATSVQSRPRIPCMGLKSKTVAGNHSHNRNY